MLQNIDIQANICYHIAMKSKKQELRNYYGENVEITGVVNKISAQRGLHFDKKTILLKKVIVRTANSTLEFDHMWFTIPNNAKVSVNEKINRTGTVTSYQRRDNSYDYSIKLDSPAMA